MARSNGSNDSLLDFNEQVIIITGAASGLGAALAIELAQRGAKLVLGDLNEDGLGLISADCQKHGAETVVVAGDVQLEDYAIALTSAAIKAFGKLTIAVNNAGISPGLSTMLETDSKTFDKQYSVNTKGVALGIKHQVQAIADAGGGMILNVSSVAGISGAPMFGSYSAAKHAVIGLTKTAAYEFAKLNVRVNAICPFFTNTPMINNDEYNPGNDVELLNKSLAVNSPMRRIARTEEIVNVMVLMLSPVNTYMNGSIITVDGGMTAI